MIIVKTQTEKLEFRGQNYACRIGQAGAITAKDGREGDAKTPWGSYFLRFGLIRTDRLPWPIPQKTDTGLCFHPLRPDDGWCDDPQDPAYNRFVRRPYPGSHEILWRDDGAYDIILVMNHNDSPPQIGLDGTGLGSAVFIHIAQPDDRKTLGCVALAPEDMVKLLPYLTSAMGVTIIP